MSDRIVLQITDFLRFVFINSDQILHYLNQYFEKHMDSIQYCEGIDNGFLFVFRDFEAYKLRASPVETPMLKDLPDDLTEKMQFWKSFFIPPDQFPAEGIEIEIKVMAGDPAEVKPIAEKFILSVDAEVIISHPDPQTLVMKLVQYKTIQRYVNSLVRRFYLSLA